MTDNQQAARECHSIAWLDRIDRSIQAMKGRPLSSKQRAAVLGVLLTLDPASPFYTAPPRPTQERSDEG